MFKSHTLRTLSLTILVVFALTGAATSQEDTPLPDGPIYIVQSGDTLYSIAQTFGVTVNGIIEYNGIDDPSALFPGDRLVIPGLAGISGILEARNTPFGETLRSIQRQYQLPLDFLIQLNRLTSPQELYVNAPLVIPINGANASPNYDRRVFQNGDTLLEMAVKTNTSTWALAQTNNLAHTNQAIPQDVLLIPTTETDGPQGLPGAISDIQITPVYQGRVTILRVAATNIASLTGSLPPYDFQFQQGQDGAYYALQGTDALIEIGMYPITIRGQLQSGETFTHTQYIRLRPVDYAYEYINVDPDLLEPTMTGEEKDFLLDFLTIVTPQKQWGGAFLFPAPYPDCINSTFGNRRSYNGSAFTFYHTGVDLCGGTGLDIIAPATGTVVFAGELTVRGFATIIDHGWGVFSTYYHQNELLVATGDKVSPGDVIGRIGTTGRSTGPHLHFEIWAGGVPVNPLNWFVEPYP